MATRDECLAAAASILLDIAERIAREDHAAGK